MRISKETRSATAVTYVQRVNRAIDHIVGHLDEPLRLRELARVALLSPFHFHRVFQALIGSTPADFVQRLRLDTASEYCNDETFSGYADQYFDPSDPTGGPNGDGVKARVCWTPADGDPYDGLIIPGVVVDVPARCGGTVGDLSARPGDPVTEQTVLGTLHPDPDD